MRIGIISDTHGSLSCWQRIVHEVFHGVDIIIHAGDIFYHGVRNPLPSGYDTFGLAQALNHSPAPLLCCRGNCDSDVDQLVVDVPIQAPYLLCQFDNVRLIVHHGHLFTDQEILRLASQWKSTLCVSGHTHVPRLEQQGNVVFLNPGSSALPKEGYAPSVALIETGSGGTEITEVSIVDFQNNKTIKTLSLSC
ncbi:MAG TPA: phosphodiesterase [Thermodesulfobacteriota bacterium]|nr:phosphodiesterase [Deltaproteobacteria bacterium]HNR11858.1 phosphodiesterase [Thermodesulfobacteriota bacterium]HNU70741.1 phosphodiesterase [Thermodesulfobacteriota bacterium]HQO79090.1 phosphodiesterase [Thermodesulfobacteriota bacterium]